MFVIKRDGKRQRYSPSKVYTAVLKCLRECPTEEPIEGVAEVIRNIVTDMVSSSPTDMSVEELQDAIEGLLMEYNYHEQAKHYILYRAKRTELRKKRLRPDPDALASYIHPAKYARYLPEKSRRETFEETVDRVKQMHLERYPYLSDQIERAFEFVYAKKVLPSSRSLQFAGMAILRDNARMFNCSFSYFDRIRFPQEALYLLMCGAGVGFSVQKHHVDKLPALAVITQESPVVHHHIEDSVIGWADAVGALLQGYLDGVYVEFDYSQIRGRGRPLVTSGGKAPGHRGLKNSLERIRTKVLDPAQGRKLRPIECHRLVCIMADAVLSGGIRRSSCISLFSPDDDEMMYCKTGKWYEEWPELANANNSVVIPTQEATPELFHRVMLAARERGDPGFFFTPDREYGINPCAEALITPYVDTPTGRKTGFGFCNLCEINAAKFETEKDFVDSAKAAAVIGTLQAGYNEFPYLGEVTEAIMRRDSLLGVGITSMMESPEVALSPEAQGKAAGAVKETNAEIVAIMREHGVDINPAARTTVVKPSGTSTLELGQHAAGIHPAHSKLYFRRVTADPTEPVFQYFKSINPHMCVRKPDGKYVIEFPIKVQQGTVTKQDVTAIEFLETVQSTWLNWILPGTRNVPEFPGAVHGISNTVFVREDEWEVVEKYIWEHYRELRGIAVFGHYDGTAIPFLPEQAVTTLEDEARWNMLVGNYTRVDYTRMMEQTDETAPSAEVACSGGACMLQ